jgi:hypothetical protein
MKFANDVSEKEGTGTWTAHSQKSVLKYQDQKFLYIVDFSNVKSVILQQNNGNTSTCSVKIDEKEYILPFSDMSIALRILTQLS